MKPTDTFTYKSSFAEYPNCRFKTNRYQSNGNLYLAIESDEEGPICTCSVNTDLSLDDDMIAIKTYSENQGMDKRLIALGIIREEPEFFVSSGWVNIPVFRLTDSGKELFADLTNE